MTTHAAASCARIFASRDSSFAMSASVLLITTISALASAAAMMAAASSAVINKSPSLSAGLVNRSGSAVSESGQSGSGIPPMLGGSV